MNVLKIALLLAYFAALRAEACSLYFFSSDRNGQKRVGLQVDQTRRRCVADDFNRLVAGSGSSDRPFLKQAIKDYFSKDRNEQWSFEYLQDYNQPEKILEQYFVVTTPQKPAGTSQPSEPGDSREALENFHRTFGTDFSPDRIGKAFTITPPASPQLFTNAGLISLVADGYSVVEVIGSGLGRGVGDGLTAAFNAAVYGSKAKDPVAAIDRAQMAAAAVDDLRRVLALRQAAYDQALSRVGSILVFSKSQFEDVDESATGAGQALENTRQRLQAGVDRLTSANSRVSELQGLNEAALAVQAQDFEKLKQGAVSAAALKQSADGIEAALSASSLSQSLLSLESLQDLAHNERNPYRKAQYQNLLANYLDNKGLVKSWADARSDLLAPSVLDHLSQAPDPKTAQVINRALGIGRGTVTGDDSDRIARRMMLNVETSIRYRSGSDPSDQKLGERRLSRAQYMFEYAVNSDFAKSLHRYTTNSQFSTEFGYTTNGETYSGLQILSIGNRLAPLAASADESTRFHAVMAMHGMKANAQNAAAFELFADHAWAVLDFTSGLGAGLALSVWDAVQGVHTLVRHPVDSVLGIKHAMLNYQETWSILRSSILENYEKVAHCGQDTQACGEVIGSISGDLALSLVGIGAVKNLGRVGVLAEGLEAAAEVVAKRGASLTERGAKFGVNSADQWRDVLRAIEPGSPCRSAGANLLLSVAAGPSPCSPALAMNRIEDAVSMTEKAGTSLEESIALGKVSDAAPNALQTYWPPNRGFLGHPSRQTLSPGTLIDRYGQEGGTFVSPKGTPFEARALPAAYAVTQPYKVYEVLKPITADAGKTAPWFGSLGLGTQYELPSRIADLIRNGYLREVQR